MKRNYTIFYFTSFILLFFAVIPVSNKFYSRHEAFDFSKADPQVLEEVTKYLDKGPKEKYEWPATVNQCYGWFSTPLVPLDRNDERFYFPRNATSVTRQMMKIKQETIATPKFTGIPWKF